MGFLKTICENEWFFIAVSEIDFSEQFWSKLTICISRDGINLQTDVPGFISAFNSRLKLVKLRRPCKCRKMVVL
jgi:hypothetical protein